MSTELINRSAEHLCTNLAGYARQGKETNVWRDFGRMTMDVVGSVAFGWAPDSGLTVCSPGVAAGSAFSCHLHVLPSHAPHLEGLLQRKASKA